MQDDETPSWVMVNVWPPAVMVAVRAVVVVFAATVNVTVPLPDPAVDPVSVTHAALEVALHAHPDAVVIENDPLPPAAAIAWEAGEIAYEQAVVAAACVTETTCPAIMMVPVRCVVVVFGATLNVTVPLPDPLALPVMVIQLAVLYELHAHPAPVVMVTEAVPPAAGTDCEAGLTEYVQGAAASCVTVNVWPPTVIVPVREVVALFAPTLNVTVPLPEPLAPAVTTIQLTVLDADHVQPAPVVTVNEPGPPAEGIDCDTGPIEYVQGGAASCVTVNVCPPTVIVPVRCVVAVLAATLNATVPLPVPVAVPVIVIQLTLLAAVHEHPPEAATANEPVPPADPIDCDAGVVE